LWNLTAIEDTPKAPTSRLQSYCPAPPTSCPLNRAHSRGCASGNTLAPVSRGITLRAHSSSTHGSFLRNSDTNSTSAALHIGEASTILIVSAVLEFDEKKLWIAAFSIMARCKMGKAKRRSSSLLCCSCILMASGTNPNGYQSKPISARRS